MDNKKIKDKEDTKQNVSKAVLAELNKLNNLNFKDFKKGVIGALTDTVCCFLEHVKKESKDDDLVQKALLKRFESIDHEIKCAGKVFEQLDERLSMVENTLLFETIASIQHRENAAMSLEEKQDLASLFNIDFDRIAKTFKEVSDGHIS